MQKYYPGAVVSGTVVGIKPYGAFISLENDISGLLHISEITDLFVSDVNKYVQIGQVLKLKILDLDIEQKHAKLSLKAVKNVKNRRKYNLSEEHFNAYKEFRILKEQLPRFIKETNLRLKKEV
jgi:predicted RNA-binding protein with RPS1 domain